MLENVSRLWLAALLTVPVACIVDADDDDNDTNADAGTGSNDSGTPTSSDDGGSTDDSNGSDTGTPGTGSDTGSADTGSGGGSDTGADESGAPAGCGWGPTGDETVPNGYVCGGSGEDPDGVFPLACPDDTTLTEGGECGSIMGVGCCDAYGNAWFCGSNGADPVLVPQDCG
jgi:hypothetical protein